MKILYVTTVGITMRFFVDLIQELIEKGHTIDIATNEKHFKVPDCYREWGCEVYHISTSRSPFSFGNIKAIKQIRAIAKKYDIVHCHTPLAGLATRLACRTIRKKSNLKVIYTAHGFHFFKGAPKKNWIIYYPIEKICSKWTDLLITITKEDYSLVKKKMKASLVEYIPGVGVDVDTFASTKVNISEKRKEIGIPYDSKMVLSVGELNKNKNHRFVITALSILNDNSFYYVIAGEGEEKKRLAEYAKKNNVNLVLLGYRSDIRELLKIADVFVLPSLREGLNVSAIESIASGCPTILSNIRGNVDIVPPEQCFSLKCNSELVTLLKKCGTFVNKVDCKRFSKKEVIRKMISVYTEIVKTTMYD